MHVLSKLREKKEEDIPWNFEKILSVIIISLTISHTSQSMNIKEKHVLMQWVLPFSESILYISYQ